MMPIALSANRLRLFGALGAFAAQLALCAPAAADPGTIGALLVGAEVGSSVIAGSLTVGQVVGFVALTAASLALSVGANYLLQRQAQDPRQDGQLTTRQPTPSRRRGYGRYMTGGAVIFSEVAIVSGLTSRYELTALHQGEIDFFEQHWLDDHHSLFSGGDNGTVVTGEFHLATVPYVALQTRKGVTPETAYADLTANFATIWSSAHRGDGIASALVIAAQPPNFDNFTTVYPGGAPPNYRAVIRASKVWDPRTGGQDKDTPATWAWRDNPVCAILDYHRHGDGLGLAAFDATLFTPAALAEDWIPAANICDESVGGVTRYRLGGSYSIAEDAPADVLAAMLAACDGQLYQRPDGAIGIRVGKTVAPAITLTDAHILGYSGLTAGANAFLACNEVTAKFTSAAHDYQLVDAEPWRDEDDITARGQVLTRALSLPWVQNHSQARRLMKLAHARANPAWQGTLVTDMAGLALINERFVHVTINEVGLDAPLIDADFEIVPDSFSATVTDQGLRCSIGISALEAAAYDWDELEEAGTPPAVPADE